MSNNWSNATVPKSERLKKIRSGDVDVYKKEKTLNAQRRKERVDAGIDTYAVDNWDRQLDAAMRSHSTPSFYSPEESRAILGLFDTNSRYLKSIKDLKQEAAASEKYITEWLKSNGYSTDGSLAKSTLDETKKAYTKAIDDLEKQHSSFRRDAARAFNLKHWRSV